MRNPIFNSLCLSIGVIMAPLLALAQVAQEPAATSSAATELARQQDAATASSKEAHNLALLQALLKGESGNGSSVAELLGGVVPDPTTIKQRLALAEDAVRSAANAVEAAAQQLEILGKDFPALVEPERPVELSEPPKPPLLPQVKRPGRPSGRERRALREYEKQKSEYEERKIEYDRNVAAFDQRMSAYKQEVAERDETLTGRRQEIDWQVEGLQTRKQIASAQRDYLRHLADFYEATPSAALRAFELLKEPRANVRQRAEKLQTLQASVSQLTVRLKTLQDLYAAGRLVGFVTEQEAAKRRLDSVISNLVVLHRELLRGGDDLITLAESQENAGRGIRETVLRSLASTQGESVRDGLYLEHLRERRRLRRVVLTSGASSNPGDPTPLVQRCKQIAPTPAALGDLFSADAEVGKAQQLTQDIQSLLGSISDGEARLRLAFERELITVLEPTTSEATRNAAAQLTTEIVEDLRMETLDAWGRALAWASVLPDRLRAILSNWRTTATTVLVVLVLAALAFVLGTKRFSPARWLVRRLAKLKLFRGRVGLIVRFGNLLQTVFPSLSVLILLYGILATIGFGNVEVQLVWIFVYWIGLYWVGRQTLLGLTRPVSRGRPALIDAEPGTIELLQKTYSRVGLIFASTLIIDEVVAGWFGLGRMRVLINTVVVIWLGAWALWAATAWRIRLAGAWLNVPSPLKQELRLAQWMSEHRIGAFLSPIALIMVGGRAILKGGWWVLEKIGVTTYLRAKSLMRLSKEVESETETSGELPEQYLKEFPLYPLASDGGALVLPRPNVGDSLLEQIESWRDTEADGSLVLVGEKGIGKTTLLAQLRPGFKEDELIFHSWTDKAISEARVARELGSLFGCPEATQVEALIKAANDGPKRIIFLDEVHNVFLRTINGYRGFDALVDLVNGTSCKVFWVLVFNTFAWEFLNQSRGRTHFFRRLVRVSGWSADELKGLISQRNKRSGVKVEFDPVLLDADAGERDFQLIESADGFFRLLRDTSHGNPRVALYFWLQSLHLAAENRIQANLFKQPDIDDVAGITDEMVFVLASVCQHENLSAEDLGVVLRMKPGRTRFAMQFLTEAGLIELKHGSADSYTLAPRYYPQILRFLRGRHLLFEAR